jgi:hypothetical protein
VPRRMDCLVLGQIPNQVSIRLIHEDPTGVKWKVTFGLRLSQACAGLPSIFGHPRGGVQGP